MLRIADVLLNPKRARRHPFEMVLTVFFYVSLSLLLSYWIFPEYASLFSVFLSVVSCAYVVQGTFIVEEKKELNSESEFSLLKKHARTIKFFLILFIGFILSYLFWVIVLPPEVSLELFSMQGREVENIRSITGSAINPGNFNLIFLNNMRVLVFSLILALFYGAGSIFILVWNASIMGFVIGNLARNVVGLSSLPQIFLKYFIHGIPEMLAYFVIALMGGILFIELIKGDFTKNRIKRTLIDSAILGSVAIILLVAAALIETFISPLI